MSNRKIKYFQYENQDEAIQSLPQRGIDYNAVNLEDFLDKIFFDSGNYTSAIGLPNGTTAQRPSSPLNGDMRYNSTTSKVEVYENGAWKNFATTSSGLSGLTENEILFGDSTGDATSSPGLTFDGSEFIVQTSNSRFFSINDSRVYFSNNIGENLFYSDDDGFFLYSAGYEGGLTYSNSTGFDIHAKPVNDSRIRIGFSYGSWTSYDPVINIRYRTVAPNMAYSLEGQVSNYYDLYAGTSDLYWEEGIFGFYTVSNDYIEMSAAGLRLQNFTSDPLTVENGAIYYNTSSNVVRFYNGTAWKEIGGFSVSGTDTNGAVITADGSGGGTREGTLTYDSTTGRLINSSGIVNGGFVSIGGSNVHKYFFEDTSNQFYYNTSNEEFNFVGNNTTYGILGSNYFKNLTTLFLKERASALADISGSGQIWVKNDTPNTLWFTDDAGTDWQLNNGGFSVSGSTNNGLITYDGAGGGVVESNLLFDGTTLSVTGGTGVARGLFIGDSGKDDLRFVTQSSYLEGGATNQNNIYSYADSATTSFMFGANSSVDTGTTPLMEFTTRIGGGINTVSTRPLFAWYNYTTKVAEVAANGNWDFQGNDLGNIGNVTIDDYIYHNGESPTNTAIGFPSNDQIRLITHGNSVISISGTSGNQRVGIGAGNTNPQTTLDVDGTISGSSLEVDSITGVTNFGFTELSADPSDPTEGESAIWQSDGTASGNDGDLMVKRTYGGTTYTDKIAFAGNNAYEVFRTSATVSASGNLDLTIPAGIGVWEVTLFMTDGADPEAYKWWFVINDPTTNDATSTNIKSFTGAVGFSWGSITLVSSGTIIRAAYTVTSGTHNIYMTAVKVAGD